jgi:hypothetical protein
MTTDTKIPTDGNERACELVGRFAFYFARLEAQLSSAMATLFKLDDPSVDILAANVDFARKLSIVQSAVREQNASPDQEWLQLEIDETFNDVFKINDKRIILAHSLFEAHADDGVKFSRTVAREKLNRHEKIWTEKMFACEFEAMVALDRRLENVLRHIQPYVPKMDFSDPRNNIFIAAL